MCRTTTTTTQPPSSTTTQASSSTTTQAPSSTTTQAPSSSSTTTRASSTATGPVAAPTVGLYTYQGCYIESAGNGYGRALPQANFPTDLQTAQLCATNCALYQYFGLEYGRECWCANALNVNATKTAETDCNMPCAADKSQLCGDGNRLNVYYRGAAISSSSTVVSTTVQSTTQAVSSTTTQAASTSTTTQAPSSSSTTTQAPSTTVQSSSTTTTQAPTTTTTTLASTTMATSTRTTTTTTSLAPVYTGPPVTSQGNVNFTYYSCVAEPSAGKLFPKQVENNATMTIDRCLSVCSNYAYAGVEYGRECWCGNTINFAGNTGAVPGKNVSDADCSTPCPGNSSQFCGNGNRINLYWFDLNKAVKNGAVDLSAYMPPINF